MAICAHCNKDRELCESHAIPDAFFRGISRKNNGQLVAIPKGDGKVHHSQNSGKAQLLCKECEDHFNQKFDKYLVNAFKEWDQRIVRHGFKSRMDFSADHLTQCLASVVWRAAQTENSFYVGAKVNDKDSDKLRQVFAGEEREALKKCSCSINRLNDKASSSDGGFSQQILSQVILPVHAYRGAKKQSEYIAFTLIMQGFMCKLVVPRLPHSSTNNPGFLRSGAKRLHAPTLHFSKYPRLMDALVAGVEKEMNGSSTLKRK